MKLKRLLLAAAWCVAAAAGSTAWAGRLQISQVADRAPALEVFLSGSDASAVDAAAVSAVLGSQPLKATALQAWNRDEGVGLVVALDVSASLSTASFRQMREQLVRVLQALPLRSHVAVVTIGREPSIRQAFKPLGDWVGPELAQLSNVATETALYEAVLQSQELAAQVRPALPLRRAVLVLTDGLDDSQRGYSREEAMGKIAQGAAPVYALGLLSDKESAAQREALKSLAQIARASGGGFLQARGDDSGAALDTLLAQLLQLRLLTLDCARCVHDGSPRSLQVTLQLGGDAVSDLRDVRLRGTAVEEPPVKPGHIVVNLGGIKLTLNVNLSLGISLLLLFSGVGGYWAWKKIYRKPPQPTPPPQPTSSPQPTLAPTPTPTSTPVSTPGPTSPPIFTPIPSPIPEAGLAILLDIAGRGREKLTIARDTVFGRAADADVCISGDPEASGRHAALYVRNGALMVRDLASSNGTYLNGVKIQSPEPVQDRDALVMGRTEMRVYLDPKA